MTHTPVTNPLRRFASRARSSHPASACVQQPQTRRFRFLISLFATRCCVGLSLALLCAATPGYGQAFLAEWTASANGGVGPTGLALATESGTTYLYVSDHPRGRIIKFNAATGAVVATFGEQGTAPGQFNQPYGLAIDPASGHLYVAERGNHRVQRVTNTGAPVMVIGGPGTAQGQFNEPVGVAVDSAGNVYVTEHTNHRVQKFSVTQSGTTWNTANLAMWGTQGSANGQFNTPYGIAIDGSGNVLVADGVNGRVQRFSNAGTFQSIIGGQGTAAGQFVIATGVTVDSTGAIYVTSTNTDPQNGAASDASSQWISKFTPAGAFASRWGGAYGSGAGQFRLPFNVVVSGTRAYVADYYNTRVQVFDLSAPPGGGGGTDTTPPTVASFTIGTSTATSITYQITFSESVTGVDATDFAVVAAGGATATIGTVGGSGAVYTVPVTIAGTAGTVQLSLKASGTGIADASANAIATGATGPTHTLGGPGGGTTDTTPPAVASFTVGTSTATSVNFLIVFSEPVTGVNSADFTATTASGAGATIGAITGSGASYTVPVTFTGTGTIQLRLNASGTGIADAAGNAIVAGAIGPTFTIGSTPPPPTTDTRVASVTPPANRTYRDGDVLNFTVRFSGNVTVIGGDDDDDREADGDDALADRGGNSGKGDDDDDDEMPFFTWQAVGGTASGKVHYVSGSRTNTLTFRYKVHNGDVAPNGILPGTTIQLPSGAAIRESSGRALAASALVLPWTQNPLTGVILDAPKSNNGKSDRLVNLSSRLRVVGGDANRSVFAGFVVTGSAPKLILLRAVGPGLKGFGIRDALDAPRLELRDSTGRLIAGNDGWGNRADIAAATDRLGAFKLGHGSKDAALLLALAPGAYTAQVTANGNGTMLLEIYDASSRTQLPIEQIVNISTRGFVDGGDDQLIAGFVIAGNGPKRVLIRGVGPGLTRFGLTGVLANPVLKLHRAGTVAAIAQNDDWQTPQPINSTQTVATVAEISAATLAAGAFPLAAGSKDAAILVTLPPGNYSAIVTGANNGSGAGLVEVYEVPSP